MLLGDAEALAAGRGLQRALRLGQGNEGGGRLGSARAAQPSPLMEGLTLHASLHHSSGQATASTPSR